MRNLLTIVAVSALCPLSAAASIITYHFTANLQGTSAALIGYDAPSISGTFSLDDSIADQSADPTEGEYDNSVTAVAYSDAAGDDQGSANSGNVFLIDDTKDQLLLNIDTDDGLTGITEVVGFDLVGIRIALEDSDGSTFPDDSFPVTLDLLSFTSERILSLRFRPTLGGDLAFAGHEITSLVRVEGKAPVPSTLTLLLGTALMLISIYPQQRVQVRRKTSKPRSTG